MSQVDGMDPLFFTQCLCTSHRSYRLPDMRALEGSSPHKSTLHTHARAHTTFSTSHAHHVYMCVYCISPRTRLPHPRWIFAYSTHLLTIINLIAHLVSSSRLEATFWFMQEGRGKKRRGGNCRQNIHSQSPHFVVFFTLALLSQCG